MFKEGDAVRVVQNVNRDLPIGSLSEVLSVKREHEYPYELLGSFEHFAADELELVAA